MPFRSMKTGIAVNYISELWHSHSTGNVQYDWGYDYTYWKFSLKVFILRLATNIQYLKLDIKGLTRRQIQSGSSNQSFDQYCHVLLYSIWANSLFTNLGKLLAKFCQQLWMKQVIVQFFFLITDNISSLHSHTPPQKNSWIWKDGRMEGEPFRKKRLQKKWFSG